MTNTMIDWSKETYRTAFTKSLTLAAEENPEIVLMVADLGRAIKAGQFIERFPKRYVQAGIAEQNMIGMAGGLASCGKIPFAATFAPFATMRCCEQIRDDVAYPMLNVKIVGHDCGVAMSTLGATHYGLEDMGVMTSIPQMTVFSPASGPEILQAIQEAAEYDGPVYIRLGGGHVPYDCRSDPNLSLREASVLKEGKDVTLIATGTVVGIALAAVEMLRGKGIDAGVVNIRCVKPIDREAIIAAAKKTRHLVTIEEHTICGGLGTAVADVLAESGVGRLKKLGLPDHFDPTVAPRADMMERYRLTPSLIAEDTACFLSDTD